MLDLHAISGGQLEHLTVTEKISVEGISDKCINTLMNVATLDDSEIFIPLLTNCTLSELYLLDARSDAASFITVNYK